MASYDQLSAQQRAIVDLILKRGQSYDQLADTLGMPEPRVRELAGEALTSLAPVSARAVDDDWRSEIADYLLGQQDPKQATATRGHLRRSEPARAWSRSVLDSLEHLYPNGELPTIPSSDGGPAKSKPPGKAGEPKAATPRRELSPEAAAVVRRRRLAAAAATAVALLLIVLVWPVGLLTGDDSDDGGDSTSGMQTELIGQGVLRAVPDSGANRNRHAGLAVITRRGEQFELAVEARLPPTEQNQAYEVWLYNSPEDAVSLGAQVTDRQGAFAGRAKLPDDYRDYRFLEISRETVDRNADHSGESILRTRVSSIRPPQGDGGGAGQGAQP
ncbi:MAG TPA: anti-sigma factor [Thermoleophilaceae bacterium]|nr:anti-sigma factor [Thermoleophilaceae bacterium]